MQAEDQRSRLAWDTGYRNSAREMSIQETRHNLYKARILDQELRECELMGWEGILSSYVREAEEERIDRMYVLSNVTSADIPLVVTMARDLCSRIEKRMRDWGPPGKAQEMGKHEIYAGIKVVSEPIDTDWWRLLQETACTFLCIRELLVNNPKNQRVFGELGVGKYLCKCLPEELTKTANVFHCGMRMRDRARDKAMVRLRVS